MASIGMTKWDNVAGRKLYDRLLPFSEIGELLGTSGSQVSSFASRHWPPRDKSKVVPGKPRVNAIPADRVRRAKALKPGASTLPPLLSEEHGA